MYDLVRSEDVRRVWDLIFTPKLMSRPFVLPPGVPPDRVAALREAFARMVQDPAFVAEMDKIQYEVSFVPGAEMDQLIRHVYAVPTEIVGRMIDAIGARDRPAGR
jgi:tripartite-type tricarboxylate transporter receptor subunit TctC